MRSTNTIQRQRLRRVFGASLKEEGFPKQEGVINLNSFSKSLHITPLFLFSTSSKSTSNQLMRMKAPRKKKSRNAMTRLTKRQNMHEKPSNFSKSKIRKQLMKENFISTFQSFKREVTNNWRSYFPIVSRLEAQGKGTTLEMDGKWWAWNIAGACLPGTFFLIMFEYFREESEEFYREMNKEKKKHIPSEEIIDFDEDYYSQEDEIQGSVSSSQSNNKHDLTPELKSMDLDLVALLKRVEMLERSQAELKQKKRHLRHELEQPHRSGIQQRVEERRADKFSKQEKDRNQNKESVETDKEVIKSFFQHVWEKCSNNASIIVTEASNKLFDFGKKSADLIVETGMNIVVESNKKSDSPSTKQKKDDVINEQESSGPNASN